MTVPKLGSVMFVGDFLDDLASVDRTFKVVGVQQLVGQRGIGLAQEAFIDAGDFRIVMGFAHRQVTVFLVEGQTATRPGSDVVAIGLSTAANAATGTSHDLDKVPG